MESDGVNRESIQPSFKTNGGSRGTVFGVMV